MTRPIVLATDFSPTSDAAIPHALELARLWDAPLAVLGEMQFTNDIDRL